MAYNSFSHSPTGYFVRFRQSLKQNILDKLILFWFFRRADKKAAKGLTLPPYGIRMYVGLPGTGKTVSMVEYLMRLRFMYPKIKIYTNFGFKYQDGEITSIDDFAVINSEDGVVFAVDELQLSFQSRKFNSFPSEMIFLLTQNRKFKKHFVCTAQLFEHVDKIFRDLTNTVVQCKNWGSRWFFQKAYTTLDYRVKINPEGEKVPFSLWKYSFIATDFLFYSYDTYKIVDSFNRERKADEVKASDILKNALQGQSKGEMTTTAKPVRSRAPETTKGLHENNIKTIRFL